MEINVQPTKELFIYMLGFVFYKKYDKGKFNACTFNRLETFSDN